jgi:hypothetical protein
MEILRAPVFIVCCIAFVVHQFMQKVMKVPVRWIDDYLDNLLITPILLTFLIVERRVLFRRGENYTLSLLETVVATAVIAVVCELLFPYLSDRFVTDAMDIIFYTLGSIVFYLFINPWRRRREGINDGA